VFVYTPRFKQVLKDSWGRWSAKNFFFPGLPGASEALQELIGGYRWEIRGTGKVGGDGVVEVLLKKPGKDGERLTLWLGTEDGIPRKTELASGTLKLTTTLSSVKLNPDLDRGLFRFEKPAGIEVIEVP
jgi:outer membrane lipoprotein-sorting protein